VKGKVVYALQRKSCLTCLHCAESFSRQFLQQNGSSSVSDGIDSSKSSRLMQLQKLRVAADNQEQLVKADATCEWVFHHWIKKALFLTGNILIHPIC